MPREPNGARKRILVEVPADTFHTLKNIKVRVGDPSWNELITRAILEYGSVRAGGMYCTGWGEGVHWFTDDGKMVIDLPSCLAELLDAENYWLGSRNPPRWKILRVQSVFTAFAWYLAHANELRHYWDHTGEYLAEELLAAFQEIGLGWEQARAHVSLILSTIYSMYPWLWGKKLASKIGGKVLERLEKKYPGIRARWATAEEDTRGERMYHAKVSMLIAGHAGIEKAYSYEKTVMPKLCIEGVSVVTEWKDETGEHTHCYTFVD